MKKKTAMLSDQFEAEEKLKAKDREDQIRMLEETKAKLMADDSEQEDVAPKKEVEEPKKDLKKKKKKWPKMEIHDTSSNGKSKLPATEMVKKLLSLHQKEDQKDQNVND